MNPTELLSALHTAERLKDTTRHCCTSRRRPESVAGHSWRIALMAYWMRDEFPEADMDDEAFCRQLEVLERACRHNSLDIRRCVADMVPTYHPKTDQS